MMATRFLIFYCACFLISNFTNLILTVQDGQSRKERLSENYQVEWRVNFDEKTVEFSVTVNSTGYVGFGLSLNGGMAGADIVIGGVTSAGENYFKDYHGPAEMNGMPIEDQMQNWHLLEAWENSGVTFLKFKRNLITCDPNREDISITEGTIKMIWSIGETDKIGHHGFRNRGAFAVNLLDPPFPEVDLSKFHIHNFVMKVRVSSLKDTTYPSVIFKRQASAMSHIVAFKPKLDNPEALKHTHHFNVYRCTAPAGKDPEEFFDKYVGAGDIASTWVSAYCNNDLYAWSLGGRLLVFPEDVGLPWGVEKNEYIQISFHLDNSEKVSTAIFETGITIYHTDKLRAKEAGVFTIPYAIGPALLIPPNTKDWKIVSHCSPDCTKQILPNDGINLFNINLHAHLSGRKMRLRQFRNGTELPWIANDENYDAQYQENRPLVKPVKILPGDQVTFECTYDSNWKMGKPVIGGLSTSDEMCMMFAFYYPKSPLEECGSSYPLSKVYKVVGTSNIMSGRTNWTSELKSRLQNEYLNGSQAGTCFYSLPDLNSMNTLPVTYPVIEHEYEEETVELSTCNEDWSVPEEVATTDSNTIGESESESSTGLRTLVWTSVLILIIFIIIATFCVQRQRYLRRESARTDWKTRYNKMSN